MNGDGDSGERTVMRMVQGREERYIEKCRTERQTAKGGSERKRTTENEKRNAIGWRQPVNCVEQRSSVIGMEVSVENQWLAGDVRAV